MKPRARSLELATLIGCSGLVVHRYEHCILPVRAGSRPRAYIDHVENKARLGIEIVIATGAVVAYGVGFHFGGQLHSKAGRSTHLDRLLAYAFAAAWLVLATYTTRQLANHVARAVSLADTATAASLRLVLTIVGLVVVLLMTLGILRVGVSQLLLGGAITGVVLGLAAQQTLGNMFAGIVLLMARPFRAGDMVRVRTGSLGGPLEGHVVSMGLIYVVFTTEEGTTLVPNLTLLASGIVRSPRPLPPPAPLVVLGGPVPVEAPSQSEPSEPAPPSQP